MMLFLRVIGIVFERKDVLDKIEKGTEELTESDKAILNVSFADTYHYCLFNLSVVSELIA